MQGQPSKFTWINIVVSFRTQVKSNKGLKGAVVFTRRCFTTKLIWKISHNIHSKGVVMKSSFQLSHNLQLYRKRTSSQLFSDEIRKTFLNTILYQNAVNLLKVLKEQKHFPEDVQEKKKYSSEVVLEKSWFQKFQKIHPKETVMKSPFGYVTAWNSIEKELHHGYFPMTLTRFSRIAVVMSTWKQLLLKEW